MTGTAAYILSKKIALGAVSGIKDISFSGTNLIFQFNDGSSTSLNVPLPKDGISIIKVEIDNNRHLICTMSDGSIIDSGELPGNGIDVENISLATKADIDKLFIGNPDVDTSNPTLATKEDIDNLFNNMSDIDLSSNIYAKTEDIDELFEDLSPIDPDSSGLATKEDIDKLFE